MPRALLLILTHEIAHYAGEATRQREFRLECLRNTVSAIISEILLLYWMPSFYPGREVLNEDEKFEKNFWKRKKQKSIGVVIRKFRIICIIFRKKQKIFTIQFLSERF